MFKYGNYQNKPIRNQSRMPACTSAASKPEKKISVQIKLHLTLLFQCVGGRKIASSQTVSLHSYMQSESSRHQTQTLDRTSATRGFRVMPQPGPSRGTTVKATKEEGKHHHGVWMQCKALQPELQRNVCVWLKHSRDSRPVWEQLFPFD